MGRIKTRESVKDIKILDKVAVVSERMKTALVRSKDQAENLMDDGQISPSEYAEDKIRYAAEDVTDQVWHEVSGQTKKARLQATICGSADGLSLWNHSVSIILIFALTYMAFRKTRSRSSNVAFHAGCSENTVCST